MEADYIHKYLLDYMIRKAPREEVMHKTPLPNLSFIPSNLGMSTIDLSLMPLAGREFKLKNALREVQGSYDLIVFDAPPSFGLLNLNPLMAAHDRFPPGLLHFPAFHA